MVPVDSALETGNYWLNTNKGVIGMGKKRLSGRVKVAVSIPADKTNAGLLIF